MWGHESKSTGCALPFPSFSVSRPTRTDAPLFATPCMVWKVKKSLTESQIKGWHGSIVCERKKKEIKELNSPRRKCWYQQSHGDLSAFSHCPLRRQLCVPCGADQASRWPSWSRQTLHHFSSTWCWGEKLKPNHQQVHFLHV